MSIAYLTEQGQTLLQKVQTIGYRQQDGLAEIEKIMQADPSTLLVDIRFSPKSSNMNWTQTAFKKKYKKRYVWIKALGNVNHGQDGQQIKIADPETGIEQLLLLLHDHNVLLMCGCEKYETCHRKTVYDMVQRVLNAKEVEATCFSRTEEEYQMLTRIVLEQEEHTHILLTENTSQREQQAKALRIINKLWQQKQQARDNAALANDWKAAAAELEQWYNQAQDKIDKLEERYHCKLDELLDESTPPKLVPIAAYQKVQQELEIIHKLERNPKLKAAQKIGIHKVMNAVKYGKDQDADGRTRINAKKIGEAMGMSPSTGERLIEFCETQLPTLVNIARYPEVLPDGTKTNRIYIKLDPELTHKADQIAPLDFKKSGGDRYTCAKCGSNHVKIYKKITRTLVCDGCGHTSHLDEKETIEYPNDTYTAKDVKATCFSSQNNQKNDAIIITIDPPLVCRENQTTEAAALLLAIAGDHNQHIEMAGKDKKYYSVNRALTQSDLEDHLKGGKARGALCSYVDGQTRAVCWDVDDTEGWTILQQAARQLADAGYFPLLEKSPADRGGHLWVIFDALVNGAAARETAYQIAPALAKITEYWPGLANAQSWNRVRLPGGFYNYSGIKGYCKLTNVATGESSQDGATAATLLLTSQTPTDVMATIHTQEQKPEQLAADQIDQVKASAPQEAKAQTIIKQPMNDCERDLGYKLPKVDAKWEADPKHGKITETRLYFAIMPEYAARWFNEHHTLEEIRPRERNGMALSPNGNERTASTSYHTTAEGERYTDHSQHGQRPDGTKDSGDVLELAAKVQGISKRDLLISTTKEISAQARTELESAAAAGKPIPAWLEEPCIITPAGRKRYAYLLVQSGKQHARTEQPAPVKDVLTVATEPARTEQPTELREGMRVNTPAGIATVNTVRYCDILKRLRCSVFGLDGSHYAVFDASEVTPISQGTLL